MGNTIRNVFISYARQDALEFAKRLAADLRDAGHQVFVDLTNIEKGGLWEVRLEEGIRGSDLLISVITLGALREDSVCRDEVVFALTEGKSVIPLKLDSSPNVKPTLLLARRNWIDFSIDYRGGLDCLLRHLEGDQSALQAPAIPTVTGVIPLDFGPEIARLTANFIGRAWLNRELDRWLSNSSGRAFVIIGEPGIGKSAIAAWLSLVRQAQVISVHFCTDRNSRTIEPFEFVASLVGQLCTQVNGFGEIVANRHPEVRRPRANDAFRELVVEPAHKLAPPENPLIVVLDSLDEAIRQDGETVLDVVVNQTNDLPTWLRIVATTRPDENVLRRIRTLHTLELRPDEAENAADVREFIGNRLIKLRIADLLSDDSVRLAAERLPTLAQGNFLYARMALDALEEGTLTVEDLGFLSPGMSDFYVKAFSRLFPNEDDFEIDAQSILRVLSVAMGPLPFAIIDRVSRSPKETQEVTNRRLLRLKSYLHISGKGLDGARYALFHKSLSDWLTDPDAAGSFWCFAEQGKEQLAEACWQDYENDPERMTEYALRYAMLHLRDVHREADAKMLSQDETFRQRRIQLGLSSFFLSYARGDDEAFVSKLHHDLISQGFDIWFDRTSMNTREEFLTQVRQAIDQYDRLVIVIGPKALTSDYIAAEWQHALISGKAITPVLRIGEYVDLPDKLQPYHILDVRDDARYEAALAEFVRLVTTPLKPLGQLFDVPPLPPSFVARPELMRELTDALLGDVHEPKAVVPVTVGINGLGGIGKTILAAAFARTPEVRRAFPDGVFWLTLGQHPNIVELQKQLLSFLGGPTDIKTSEEGRAKLRLFLADARALIVLDDVWEARAAEEFTYFGPQCRTLLTTRNIDAAKAVGSSVLAIDSPSDSDAEALLAKCAETSVGALPPVAHEVIKMLGNHPLAIAITGAMFRNGASWVDLKEGIRRGLADFADPRAKYQHGSIMSSIKLSYEALPKNERNRLVELASALPEDSYIAVADVAQLWANAAGLSELETTKVLTLLSDRAFIRLDQASFKERVTLHPLIHQFLRETSR
ncbi:MAG TPA: TIR domain-containing protein [Pyrinomonadaceae bacterium]|nr:TIR domain-containing protein [Pyrinomonadaceae bacterium]